MAAANQLKRRVLAYLLLQRLHLSPRHRNPYSTQVAGI